MKAFTLIELIFVILLIGLLSAVAIPRFSKLSTHSKDTAVKSTVSTILGQVENIHGEWIVNDSFTWTPEHGNCDLNTTSGYPQTLDSNGTNLFECVMKIPVVRCNGKTNGCFEESNTNEYEFYFSPDKVLKFKYDSSNGEIICEDGINYTASECNETLFE